MAGNSNSGRRAIPLKVLELEGKRARTDRRGRIASDGHVPQKPQLSAIAAEHWDFVCAQQKNWISASDGPALKMLCELWELVDRMFCELVADPANKDARLAHTAHLNQWIQLAGRFGLTPADRAKHITEHEESTRTTTEKYLA